MAHRHDDPGKVAFFDKCGRFLYGEHYVAPLAVALGVRPDTVKNWRKGRSTIPPNVLSELYRMCGDRQAEFTRLSDAVKMMLPERQA